MDNEENIKLPEGSDTQDKAETAGEELYTLPEGAVAEGEIVDRDFWKGITLPRVDKPKKQSNPKGRMITLLLCLLFLVMGCAITTVAARGKGTIANLITGNKHMTFTLPMQSKPEDEYEYKDAGGKYTAEGIAKVCMPSVVSIDIYKDMGSNYPYSTGSGVILSSDGYIVTNAHVANPNAYTLKVVLSDGRSYVAEIIGRDEPSDIAVLKIPTTGLVPATFGDSLELRLGEEVVAIGSPSGYKNSVTKGVVSGFNREVYLADSDKYMSGCIQTDCAINPGNSGGALFNMWGQVVGITSSKMTMLEIEGLAFAIPSNTAKELIEQLMEHGRVLGRPRIGITYYQISSQTAAFSEIMPGLLVVSIDENCDVANTKLEVGDIITTVDGFDVSNTDNAPAIIANRKPGDTMTCHVFRPAREDGSEAEEFDITFALAEDTGTLSEYGSIITTDQE